ncbi:hypothetical protein ABEB36_009065 [Hypothenemus hampei]|uniref:Tetraspanin n=1 Tax=Hypothenemus hampei TaxID=57062 RepID=A0ABD1ET00_HYPHA
MSCVDLKLLLYVINGVLLFFAIVLVSAGIYGSRIPGPAINGSSYSILIGSFAFMITIVGMIALRLHQVWLSIIYIVLLISMLFADLVFGIKTISMDERLEIKSFLKTSYLTSTKNGIDRNIRDFQDFFKCCGYNGPHSADVIVKSPIYLSKGNENQKPENATYLINECCPKSVVLCMILDAYSDNCVDKIMEKHGDFRTIVGTFLIISSILMGIATVLGVIQLTTLH